MRANIYVYAFDNFWEQFHFASRSDFRSTTKSEQIHNNYCLQIWVTPKDAPRHDILFKKLAATRQWIKTESHFLNKSHRHLRIYRLLNGTYCLSCLRY